MNIFELISPIPNRSKEGDNMKVTPSYHKKMSMIDKRLAEVLKIKQKEPKRKLSDIQLINNQAFYSDRFYTKELLDTNKPQYIRKLLYQNKVLLDQIDQFKNFEELYYKEKIECERWKKLAENCKEKYEKMKQRIGEKYKKTQETPQEKPKYSVQNLITLREESITMEKLLNKFITIDSEIDEKSNKLQKGITNDSFTYSDTQDSDTRKLKTDLENEKKIRIYLQSQIIKEKEKIEALKQKFMCTSDEKSVIINQQFLILKTQNQQLKTQIRHLKFELAQSKQTVQKIKRVLSTTIPSSKDAPLTSRSARIK